MSLSMIERAANVAEYQARAALRADRAGDEGEYARHQNLMFDVLEAQEYPRVTTQMMVRRLGPGRSRFLGVSPDLIAVALAAE